MHIIANISNLLVKFNTMISYMMGRKNKDHTFSMSFLFENMWIENFEILIIQYPKH